MKVLVTGAAGTIGSRVVVELLDHHHVVRALDVGWLRNRLRARALPGPVEWMWGDVRSRQTVQAAVAGMDGIIHLAAILPPRGYDVPAEATSVNLDGARNIIEAAASSRQPLIFIYASSAGVYGVTQHNVPPVHPDQPVVASDAYTRAKLSVEQAVRQAPFSWVILRLSHVPILGMRMPHRVMFDLPLDNRMELLHADDAATAIVNALETEAVHSRTLLVGGGPSCQTVYKEYLEGALRAMGLDPLPAWAFGSQYHYSDWLDTTQSQEMLGYQRHSFGDIMRTIEARGRRFRPFVRAFAPVLTHALIRTSPYKAGAAD